MFEGMTDREMDAFWEGVENEQDRIIKLLKSYEVEVVIPVDFAIALIKGENK